MKHRLLISIVFLGACVFACPYARDAVMQFDRGAQRAFDELPMGCSLEEASDRLGSDPIRDAAECWLAPTQRLSS